MLIDRALSEQRGLFKVHAFDSGQVKNHILTTPGDVLYHYTDMNGLVGILQSGEIWATDSRFLNDTSEGSYAVELIESSLKRVHSESADSTNKHIIDIALSYLTLRKPTDERFFVTSFSSAHDSMYEWRTYGAGGEGAALGFHLSQPTEVLRSNHNIVFAQNTCRLLKCIYDQDLQLAIVKDLCDLAFSWQKYLSSNTWEQTRGSTAPSDLARGLLPSLLFLAPAFKRKEFHIENEWRLVTAKVSDGISVRTSGSGIKPYCKLNILNEPFSDLGPIVVGNQCEFDITKVAIGDLLSHQFGSRRNNIEVKKSNLVLRF